MCCSRWRSQVESAADHVRAAENRVEAENESFRRSRCFLIVWRDENGRRRCKCCCRRRNDED